MNHATAAEQPTWPRTTDDERRTAVHHTIRAVRVAGGSGGVPTISTAWDRVLENQAAESVGKAVEAYTKSMSKALAVKVPQLQQALTQARNLRRSRQSAFRGSGAPRAGSADGVTGEEKEEEGGEDGTQGWGLGGCKLPLEDTALLDLDDKCRNEAMKVFQGYTPLLLTSCLLASLSPCPRPWNGRNSLNSEAAVHLNFLLT